MADDPDTVGDPSQILRIGSVASVDMAARTCTVAYGDPDGDQVESADIPWLVGRAGGTIIWSPPSEGEQGLLLSPGGDIAQAVFVSGLYSTAFPAPGDGNREFIRFSDGAEFGYDPESMAADATLPGGGTLAIVATGGVSIDGDVSIKGDVTVTKTLTATTDVVGGGKSLKNHKHGGVQAGGAQTTAPV